MVGPSGSTCSSNRGARCVRWRRLSGNRRLTGHVRELVPRTSPIIAIYQTPHHDTCSHEEHFEIIGAMADLHAAFAHVRPPAKG